MKRTAITTQFFFLIVLFISITFQACRPEGPIVGDTPDLSQLAGKWIRVESTNPSADHIRIEVIGSKGTITNKAASGFAVGDVKWQNITPSTANQFMYEELGSDYAYYNATMVLVTPNELSLTIESSGAGNSQKWIKDDGSIVSDVATVLECNDFGVDQILLNTDAAVDYIVPNGCVIDVTANLIIEPGVVIEVEENGGFGVYDQGTFHAVGTATEPIIIRGANEAQGYWRGIHIETNSIKNKLDHVTISDAGSNYVYCCNEVASVFLKDGKLSIKNTTVSNGGAFGIYAREAATFEEYSSNRITTHKEAPLYIHMERAGELDGTASDYSGNEDDHIRIWESTVDEETTIPNMNVPYLLDGKVMDITAPLALDPGVEFIIKEDGGIGVFDGGALALNGTVSSDVKIKGQEANKGYWRGIHIETNSSKNVFTFAKISDAGANYVFCCNEKATVYLKGGRLSMQSTTLSNGAGVGMYADDDAQLVEYRQNVVTTHDLFPLYMAVERFGELDGLGSSYSGNARDFISILNSNVESPTTFYESNVPYQIFGFVLDIKEALSIEAGVDIAFGENGGLGVYDNGSLNAIGNADKRIKFRGEENVLGYWRGIHIETNSNNNVLSYTEIHNAGQNYVYCCNEKAAIFLKDGKARVENSYISDNSGCGIFVKPGAILTESGNTFAGNTDGHICN
ncbi:MAG: right-handed parallel beta-helix repeat-containing protein [Bacteroidota bacterium]